MNDFLHFIQTSSSQLFKRLTRANQDGHQGEDGLSKYVLAPCNHVTDCKWTDLWTDVVEPKQASLKGIVFLDPKFMRTYYVPQSAFRCGYDDQVEYSTVSSDLMALMKDDYERRMQFLMRPDSCFVAMHVCHAAQLLQQLGVRCPELVRLSVHFFYLDDHFVACAARHLPKLVSINLENSIGLSSRDYANLSLLPKLVHLNLSGSDMSEDDAAQVLQSCRQLESLNLSNNCRITGQCFKNGALKNIKRLNIRDCWRITASCLINMAQGRLPNLIELVCNSGINDDSLLAIGNNCPKLMHLDVSFEGFTYHDDTGYNSLSEQGFGYIAKLTELQVLHLRHVGKLTNKALAAITQACGNLSELTLNLRHRHKLTDQHALEKLAQHCPKLKYFEAVHNHFIGKHSLNYLTELSSSLNDLILRGDERVTDKDAAQLVSKCRNLRSLVLDGCPNVHEKTLAECIVHAQNLPKDAVGNKEVFRASLVCTAIDRERLNKEAATLPSNLYIRVSNQSRNKEHYAEFDGQSVSELKLHHTFFPLYWQDYN